VEDCTILKATSF